ncbi:MAG: hypothetical protein M3283_13040 [Actinomycetota bacterium]|nr:hypothetical protein [Actinomycetota bacterium]
MKSIKPAVEERYHEETRRVASRGINERFLQLPAPIVLIVLWFVGMLMIALVLLVFYGALLLALLLGTLGRLG